GGRPDAGADAVARRAPPRPAAAGSRRARAAARGAAPLAAAAGRAAFGTPGAMVAGRRSGRPVLSRTHRCRARRARTGRSASGAPVRITLVDRRNHHLFQPLLYQVATAGLSAPSIAAPLRQILRRQDNATVLLDEALDVDLAARRVRCAHQTLDYDVLVVATG